MLCCVIFMLCYICYITCNVRLRYITYYVSFLLRYITCYVMLYNMLFYVTLYNMLCCVMFMLRCRTCNVCYVIITCHIYVI